MKRSHPTGQDQRAKSRREKPGPTEPSREAIAQRAYELYLARGCEHGCDIDDWLQAEDEMRKTFRKTD